MRMTLKCARKKCGSAAVGTVDSNVACCPDVFVREWGVKRLRCGSCITGGVKSAVREGVLRREAGGGEDKGEREERSMDRHGSWAVERGLNQEFWSRFILLAISLPCDFER